MRRRFAEMPEVAAVRREAVSKMKLPHAIDEHTRRERIIGLREPAGQRGAAARAVGHRLDVSGPFIDQAQDSRLDGVTGLLRDEHRWSLRAHVARRHHVGQGRGFLCIERSQFLAQGDAPFLVRALDAAFEAAPFVFDLTPGERGDLCFKRRPFRGRLVQHRLDVLGKFSNGLLLRLVAVGLIECGQFLADVFRFPLPYRELLRVVRAFLRRRCGLVFVGQQRREVGAEPEVILL